MQINKSQAEFLQSIIDDWAQEKIITDEKADELKKSLTIRQFDWKSLAKYAFIIAVISGVIAVASTFADRRLINLFNVIIEKIFNASNFILGIICAVISFVFFYFSQKTKHDLPDNFFTNEGFILMGSAFAAFTAANFANLSGKGDAYYITTFLIASLLYFIISFIIKSQITWLFAIISLTAFVCIKSANITHWQPYVFGLNYALRFLLLSLIFLGIAYLSRKIKLLQPFYSLSLYYTLSIFFIALWIVSIVGNYGAWDEWNNIPQIRLIGWALLSTGISAFAAYMGWKKNLLLIQNFGITFLILNIYTRYFEYFWNGSYKAVFFIILALSFWFIGRFAERIWNRK